MDERKKLKIGSSNFRNFIEAESYFIDKTLLIKEVIDASHDVLLIPRPRRFGKSLNLSMLKYYFDIAEKNTVALFEPYKIWQVGDYYTSQQGKYPVIHLSLKQGKANNFERSREDIYNILKKIYQDHAWLLGTTILGDSEKKDFEQVLFGEASPTLFENSLKTLSEYLFRYYNQKVFILMDEYDAPIHAGFHYGYYDEIISLMKSLMGSTFKDNDFLQKGVITGILRIARESIFSDFNNPGIFTILSSAFADKFGFTKEEVHELLTYFNLEKEYKNVQAWYDGYTFSKTQHIYNPWSILNYIAQHEDGFKAYWVNSSSDELIKSRIVEKDAQEVRQSIEKLISGEVVIKSINENIVFADFDTDKEILWSLLVFCGYLTTIEQEEDYSEYQLKIPNYEIKILFKNIILEWFKKELKVTQSTLREMAKSLTNNQIEQFKKHFKDIMGDTFSYFDKDANEPEIVYHAYVLGLLAIMSDDYVIKSNRESGKGRYDILLLPLKNLTRYGIVIEIKTLEKGVSKEQIDAELTDALNQISKNEYYKELVAHKVKDRIEMAMVFVGKEVFIDTKKEKKKNAKIK